MLQNYDDGHDRAADLAQLELIASSFKSRQKFLTELTIDPPDSTSGRAGKPLRDEDYLILSTIHSAKGLEWKYVHILNVVDGSMTWPRTLRTRSRNSPETTMGVNGGAAWASPTLSKRLSCPQKFLGIELGTAAPQVLGSVESAA